MSTHRPGRRSGRREWLARWHGRSVTWGPSRRASGADPGPVGRVWQPSDARAVLHVLQAGRAILAKSIFMIKILGNAVAVASAGGQRFSRGGVRAPPARRAEAPREPHAGQITQG